jgi:AcrR family transcriptional regulator
MRTRLAPSERRRQIVSAAMPLFARKGFSGTTTKEVAEAASVSEGLLFKYFESKTALYAAIIDQCSNDDPARFETLERMAPSTATLILTVHDVVSYFANLKHHSATEQIRHRLFIQSLLDDGEFARVGLSAFGEAMMPILKRSIDAAHRSGDMADAVDIGRSFWLTALLQIMTGSMALHGGPNPKDPATIDEWVIETSRFILRGLGVKADVARAAYGPAQFNLATDTNALFADSAQQVARVA